MQGVQFGRFFALSIIISALALSVLGQQKPAGRLVYYDHEGKQISNNEFVDIRVANSHYPDATIVKTLDDGTVEFRLQKIPQEGMTAPSFTLRTIDGTTLSPAELQGKVVVLSFWFIGCEVCRAIKPKLNRFKARFADRNDIVFLAMTADARSEVEKYLKKEPSDYLQAADADAVMKQFVFKGYPKNIVIDKQGKIVYWRGIVQAWDKFESVVRTELAKD